MCAVAESRWFQQDVIVVVENPSDQRNLERLQLACHVFGAELLLVQDAKPQDPRCRKSLDLLKEGYDSKFRISNSTTNCMKELRKEGTRSLATALDEHSVSIYDTCFDCGKIALWFGQEKHGLTDEAIAHFHSHGRDGPKPECGGICCSNPGGGRQAKSLQFSRAKVAC